MSEYKIISENKLESGSNYTSITIYNGQTYLTAPTNCKIDILDNNFTLNSRMSTCRGYNNLTYNAKIGCFIATSSSCNNKVFTLNTNLCELCCEQNGFYKQNLLQNFTLENYNKIDSCYSENNHTYYVLANKNDCSQWIITLKAVKQSKNIKMIKLQQQNKTLSPTDSVIMSIANIESSLSHILNAEGEKIQKAVALSNSTDDMLKVNDSVNKTITNIIHLEQLLHSKLEVIKDLT